MELLKSKEDVFLEFKKLRRNQMIATIPMIIAVISLIMPENSAGLFGLSQNLILGISISVIISYFIFSLFNWKCPLCNRYLGKSWNPKYCQKCGDQFR
ncbi:MAG: hypothetical protein GY714_32065 [Desulfobacterales bacterium]|nr:hypothetical protein [Desulfobacterales bacterium]MCP4163579.1 hypothetical protein [Deltaproteobacteria bacterium]